MVVRYFLEISLVYLGKVQSAVASGTPAYRHGVRASFSLCALNDVVVCVHRGVVGGRAVAWCDSTGRAVQAVQAVAEAVQRGLFLFSCYCCMLCVWGRQ